MQQSDIEAGAAAPDPRPLPAISRQPFLTSREHAALGPGPGSVLEPIGPGEWIAFDLIAEGGSEGGH